MKNVGILKYSLTVESLLEILTNRRIQAFYKLIDVHSVTNIIWESISSIRMWNIVNLACSSKKIAPRHFTYYCMLLFLSNKPSLLISYFVVPFWYSVYFGVNPEPSHFFIITGKILMRLNVVFFSFTAAECPYHVFIFHETFVSVNCENYSRC